jgi:hypothetical protein
MVKHQISVASTIMVLSIMLFSASPVLAQRQRGVTQPAPMYDPKTEITLTGIVEETKTVSGMMGGAGGRGMMQGTHIMLKTDKETIEVHLGPTAFLTEKKLELAKGDAVEVIGSRVKIGESDALLAREIKKGEASLALRDANGRPLWRGMGRR